MELSEKIKIIREKRGLTQEQLGEKIENEKHTEKKFAIQMI